MINSNMQNKVVAAIGAVLVSITFVTATVGPVSNAPSLAPAQTLSA